MRNRADIMAEYKLGRWQQNSLPMEMKPANPPYLVSPIYIQTNITDMIASSVKDPGKSIWEERLRAQKLAQAKGEISIATAMRTLIKDGGFKPTVRVQGIELELIPGGSIIAAIDEHVAEIAKFVLEAENEWAKAREDKGSMINPGQESESSVGKY